MNWTMTLRVALRALARNKMRSFLTTLGVVIGVAAVILSVAIGDGAKARVEATFASIGSNMLIVMNGSSSGGGAMGGAGSMPSLTWDDLKAIQSELTAVKDAAPVLRASAQVMSEESNWATSIQGTTPEFLSVRSWPMSQGACFTQADVDGGQKAAVLGQTVSDKLFGENANPVGQVVRVKNIPFTVVGVLGKKGQSPFGQDMDDVVLVPVSTFQQKIQGGLKNFIQGSLVVSALGGDGNVVGGTCDPASEPTPDALGAAPAPRIQEFVGLFPHGAFGSVCAADYAPFLTDAVATIDQACAALSP